MNRRQPSLELLARDLAHLARHDPVATYDALCGMVGSLVAPSAEPYAQAARLLGLAIGRARDGYAQRADEIAEELAAAERAPELPLDGVA